MVLSSLLGIFCVYAMPRTVNAQPVHLLKNKFVIPRGSGIDLSITSGKPSENDRVQRGDPTGVSSSEREIPPTEKGPVEHWMRSTHRRARKKVHVKARSKM